MFMLEPSIIRYRNVASIAWCAIAACVPFSALMGLPLLGLTAWLGAIGALIFSALRHQPARAEQLVRRGYHAIAGVVFCVAVAGSVIGMLPEASERSQLLAVFFGITAILAYRVLVARGPRPTLWLAAITCITWIPALLVLIVRCKCGGHRETNWTETASYGLFVTLLAAISVLVAITLVAFRRRTSELPDARVL